MRNTVHISYFIIRYISTSTSLYDTVRSNSACPTEHVSADAPQQPHQQATAAILSRDHHAAPSSERPAPSSDRPAHFSRAPIRSRQTLFAAIDRAMTCDVTALRRDRSKAARISQNRSKPVQ